MADQYAISAANLRYIENSLGAIHKDLEVIDSSVGTVNNNVKVVYDEEVIKDKYKDKKIQESIWLLYFFSGHIRKMKNAISLRRSKVLGE